MECIRRNYIFSLKTIILEKRFSFYVNSINRKTIDFFHLLDGKAFITILEL